MNISAPFIRRPVATSLLTAAVLLAGAIAYTFLPVAPLPKWIFPRFRSSRVCRARAPRRWRLPWRLRSSGNSAGSPASRK